MNATLPNGVGNRREGAEREGMLSLVVEFQNRGLFLLSLFATLVSYCRIFNGLLSMGAFYGFGANPDEIRMPMLGELCYNR